MSMILRRPLLALVLMAAFIIAGGGAVEAENLLSLQVGSYVSGSDYPASSEDGGGDFGIFYTNISRNVGFEIGVHGYGTPTNGLADVSVIGAELLVTVQDPMAVIQPYAGLGIGYYAITVNPLFGSEQTGNGKGVVAEVGFRVYLEEVFLGLQLKGFQNKREDVFPALKKTEDFGGRSVNLVLGLLF